MEINYTNYTDLKNTGISRAAMAEIFEIPDWKLKKLIAANNWGAKRPIIANESAFDEYSEEACYWAGFLAADGCVDSKNRVRVMLKYDDIHHLEKLRSFLQSTHTISSNTDKYNRCSFEITSAHICDVLDLNYGIIPNKTNKLKLPVIPLKFMVHYLRGYFDGDGSICESFSNKNSVTASIYATFASGSREFSESLFSYLQDKLKLGGHLQEFEGSTKWQLKFNTNDAKTLLSFMYEDSSVYLDRKYALYQRIIVNDIREMR
jgi:intein/homing endonuclease